jgi:predicted kinase
LDVILEFGFWSREERTRFRSEAESLGAQVRLVSLELPLEELWTRLERRNATLPEGCFHVSREQLEAWWTLFEPPAPDEF